MTSIMKSMRISRTESTTSSLCFSRFTKAKGSLGFVQIFTNVGFDSKDVQDYINFILWVSLD